MPLPEKLTDEVLEKTKAYLDKKKNDGTTPWVEELAVYELDVARASIYRWLDRSQNYDWMSEQDSDKQQRYLEFYELLEKLATLQLMRLKDTGLKHGKNTVAIFLMKANFGMVEAKTPDEPSGDNRKQLKPIEVMQLKERNEN